MAQVAHELMVEAMQRVGKAEGLAIRMEALLDKRYGESAIYAYTNARSVPPGDVLLAAAAAAGVSVDERLGIGRQPDATERELAAQGQVLDQLRSQLEALRKQVADLQADLMDLRSLMPEADQISGRPDRGAETG
jgi:myo-inositol catabolism protein IolC